MSKDPLTEQVTTRICNHMNTDHIDALVALAKFYGNVQDPIGVEMVSLSETIMEIKANGELIAIPFDHVLQDSSDAHETLVSMIKDLKANTQ